jgi:hypothetical protein
LTQNWKRLCPDIKKGILPPNMPQPIGKAVQFNMLCDAAHATDFVTRRSTIDLINWFSKRQNTIESSIFVSEFVALRIAVEMKESLWYMN